MDSEASLTDQANDEIVDEKQILNGKIDEEADSRVKCATNKKATEDSKIDLPDSVVLSADILQVEAKSQSKFDTSISSSPEEELTDKVHEESQKQHESDAPGSVEGGKVEVFESEAAKDQLVSESVEVAEIAAVNPMEAEIADDKQVVAKVNEIMIETAEHIVQPEEELTEKVHEESQKQQEADAPGSVEEGDKFEVLESEAAKDQVVSNSVEVTQIAAVNPKEVGTADDKQEVVAEVNKITIETVEQIVHPEETDKVHGELQEQHDSDAPRLVEKGDTFEVLEYEAAKDQVVSDSVEVTEIAAVNSPEVKIGDDKQEVVAEVNEITIETAEQIVQPEEELTDKVHEGSQKQHESDASGLVEVTEIAVVNPMEVKITDDKHVVTEVNEITIETAEQIVQPEEELAEKVHEESQNKHEYDAPGSVEGDKFEALESEAAKDQVVSDSVEVTEIAAINPMEVEIADDKQVVAEVNEIMVEMAEQIVQPEVKITDDKKIIVEVSTRETIEIHDNATSKILQLSTKEENDIVIVEMVDDKDNSLENLKETPIETTNPLKEDAVDIDVPEPLAPSASTPQSINGSLVIQAADEITQPEVEVIHEKQAIHVETEEPPVTEVNKVDAGIEDVDEKKDDIGPEFVQEEAKEEKGHECSGVVEVSLDNEKSPVSTGASDDKSENLASDNMTLDESTKCASENANASNILSMENKASEGPKFVQEEAKEENGHECSIAQANKDDNIPSKQSYVETSRDLDVKDQNAVAEPAATALMNEEKSEESVEDKEESQKPKDENLAPSSKFSDFVKLEEEAEAPKQDTPTKTPRRSNNIISKVKHSIVKAKKAIMGKSPSSKDMQARSKQEIK
ncbi:titin-like isoform X1 [Canna indica]|uniref:Titin-like isoform X1 n=1 Tax=Canna indica TaxID=4628 RepID=A0AAQ3KW20_9LILI|nr:titin-like isoform X1 [Canna indica]